VPKANRTKYDPTTRNEFLATTPLKHDETGDYIKALRPYFQMMSWEYGGIDEMNRKVSETNWEHTDLVSVLITREPLSRLLAGDGVQIRKYPGYDTGELSHVGWWDYAVNPENKETDNFFFRILEGTPNSNRQKQNKQKHEYIYTEDNLPSLEDLRSDFDLDESHYEKAVAIMNRFTVVLDIACLSDGLAALGDLLGMDPDLVNASLEVANEKQLRKKKYGEDKQGIPRDRIGYDDVYEYLVEKNQWDIKLYEYSKTISLVDCNS